MICMHPRKLFIYLTFCMVRVFIVYCLPTDGASRGRNLNLSIPFSFLLLILRSYEDYVLAIILNLFFPGRPSR